MASAPKNDDVQFPADNKKKLQLLKAYQGAARTGKHQGTISGNGFSVVVLMWAGRVHGRNAFRPGRDLTRNSAELLAACLSMAAASAFAPMANLRAREILSSVNSTCSIGLPQCDRGGAAMTRDSTQANFICMQQGKQEMYAVGSELQLMRQPKKA